MNDVGGDKYGEGDKYCDDSGCIGWELCWWWCHDDDNDDDDGDDESRFLFIKLNYWLDFY